VRLSNIINPYSEKSKRSFWRHAVSSVAPFMLDPMETPPFQIAANTKVATAGSCFAQHISRKLRASGYTHYVVENGGDAIDAKDVALRNFGTFSARYGNIYTARQLLQLFDRAFGTFEPLEQVWQRDDGRYVDPLRPQVEPTGFATADDVIEDAERHLAAVRQMFETLDVFVFTLGLTEGWRVKTDQTILPLAPGVAGGSWDPSRYEFINFEVEDITNDMIAFVDRLRSVNAGARIVLTVSPVPLIATYEDRHVLVSNTYSKSVLRVAADKVARARANVTYFPSFEIITSNGTTHRYFEADLRSVNELGVGHVMRVFFRHFTTDGGAAAAQSGHAASWSFAKEFDEASKVVCDEEAIDSR
jgi:GSCFA family